MIHLNYPSQHVPQPSTSLCPRCDEGSRGACSSSRTRPTGPIKAAGAFDESDRDQWERGRALTDSYRRGGTLLQTAGSEDQWLLSLISSFICIEDPFRSRNTQFEEFLCVKHSHDKTGGVFYFFVFMEKEQKQIEERCWFDMNLTAFIGSDMHMYMIMYRFFFCVNDTVNQYPYDTAQIKYFSSTSWYPCMMTAVYDVIQNDTTLTISFFMIGLLRYIMVRFTIKGKQYH